MAPPQARRWREAALLSACLHQELLQHHEVRQQPWGPEAKALPSGTCLSLFLPSFHLGACIQVSRTSICQVGGGWAQSAAPTLQHLGPITLLYHPSGRAPHRRARGALGTVVMPAQALSHAVMCLQEGWPQGSTIWYLQARWVGAVALRTLVPSHSHLPQKPAGLWQKKCLPLIGSPSQGPPPSSPHPTPPSSGQAMPLAGRIPGQQQFLKTNSPPSARLKSLCSSCHDDLGRPACPSPAQGLESPKHP